MAAYVYPAVFHANDDGTYTVSFPDLPGCISEGKDLENAIHMAQSALTLWLHCAVEVKEPIPAASAPASVSTAPGEFLSLVRAEVRDERAVRRTVSIPRWMDEKVTASHISLSRVLQDALRERLAAL